MNVTTSEVPDYLKEVETEESHPQDVIYREIIGAPHRKEQGPADDLLPGEAVLKVDRFKSDIADEAKKRVDTTDPQEYLGETLYINEATEGFISEKMLKASQGVELARELKDYVDKGGQGDKDLDEAYNRLLDDAWVRMRNLESKIKSGEVRTLSDGERETLESFKRYNKYVDEHISRRSVGDRVLASVFRLGYRDAERNDHSYHAQRRRQTFDERIVAGNLAQATAAEGQLANSFDALALGIHILRTTERVANRKTGLDNEWYVARELLNMGLSGIDESSKSPHVGKVETAGSIESDFVVSQMNDVLVHHGGGDMPRIKAKV